MVTGIDIIKVKYAAFTGETALKQSDINPRGHAIECRINAEDQVKTFNLPKELLVCVINLLVLEQELMGQFFKATK